MSELIEKVTIPEREVHLFVGVVYSKACVNFGFDNSEAVPQGKVYTFLNPAKIPLRKDDVVLVEDRGGYSLCSVVNFNPSRTNKATAIIHGRALDTFEITSGRQVVEKVIRLQEEMKERERVYEEEARQRAIAENDKIYASLLEELNSLT